MAYVQAVESLSGRLSSATVALRFVNLVPVAAVYLLLAWTWQMLQADRVSNSMDPRAAVMGLGKTGPNPKGLLQPRWSVTE